MNAQLSSVPNAMDAYREAIRHRNTVQAKSAALMGRIEKLTPLRQAPAAAQAVVDALKAQEGAELAEWAKTGAEGSPPKMKTTERAKAEAALADAKHAAEGAEQVVRALEAELTKLNRTEVPEMQATLRRACAEVIAEEWSCAENALYELTLQVRAEQMRVALLSRAIRDADGGVSNRCDQLVFERNRDRINLPHRNPHAEGKAAFDKWYGDTFDEAAPDPSQAA